MGGGAVTAGDASAAAAAAAAAASVAGTGAPASESVGAGASRGSAFPAPNLRDVLPVDQTSGTFVGRVWEPARGVPGPGAYRGTGLWDVSHLAGTSATLMERPALAEDLAQVYATAPTWSIDEVRRPAQLAAGEDPARPTAPTLLVPVDLQVLKACGVTFAGSMIERLIEERAQGDPARAQRIREEMQAAVGVDLGAVVPGSAEAAAVKEQLLALGWWSQYLEVGLGPDPEVFTKGPVLSAVGTGDAIGIPAFSAWNNPEPELTLVVTAEGRIAGVTLGNDVNLRDVEGRSALLLGMAKDNNRSTALGPVIRVFDEGFTLEDARTVSIELTVEGAPEAAGGDGYVLTGLNTCGSLSRTFERLVEAALGRHHQYPDGCVILTGTLFAPTEDRGVPGEGFTHAPGDRVTIENPLLGRLVNAVGRTEELAPWTYGTRALFADLTRVGLRA
ncbi:fumarylacetoacetate hydrolase family protein [Brevibacterium sp.]|uniref:fumarylacetoacetate hydrolase family protein n=1 Tax=Brevibacterium sp. TaxID=1701 RepID=UPI0025BE51B5|nr:fumarylacetoacetate hydrolase family protein [Brevibacterium sp.]